MNAYDLYEFYLEPRDLQGKAHQVKVERADVKEVFNSRLKKKEEKIVLRLEGKKKVFPLNKTQVGQMIEITGTPLTEKWAGASMVIVPGQASNGKDTIVITTEAKSGDLELIQPKQTNDPKHTLDSLRDLVTTDAIAAYSEITKRAGIDQPTVQAILRECGGSFEDAFNKIADGYKEILN